MFAFFRHRPNFRRLLIAMFALPLMFAGGSLVGGLDPSIGGVGSLEISRNEFYGAYQQLEEAYRRRYGLEEIPPELGAQLVQETRSR
ncbi:MAG: SurA N-terminal domain-containing protein, partial [Gammaproteobacteria bacterium]